MEDKVLIYYCGLSALIDYTGEYVATNINFIGNLITCLVLCFETPW